MKGKRPNRYMRGGFRLREDGMPVVNTRLTRARFLRGAAAGVAGAALAGSGVSYAQAPSPPTRNMWIVSQDGMGYFDTIQEAVDEASSGDTIMVLPGTYEGAQINKKVELIGSGDVNITMTPYGQGFDIQASGVTISNFSFYGVYYPVWAVDVDNVTISNLNINNAASGIVLVRSSGSRVTHNEIHTSVLLPYVEQVEGIFFQSGSTTGGPDTPSYDNLIAFNNISYDGPVPTEDFGNWGIHVVAASPMEGNKIIHNKVHFVAELGDPYPLLNGGIGLGDYSIFFTGIPGQYLKHNYIGFNDTRGSKNSGMMLLFVDLEEISGNKISRNLGETWWTMNMVDYENIDTGENRSIDPGDAPAPANIFKPRI